MEAKDVIIAASILTADFLNLKAELDRIAKAKISAVHFDVMDNNFVPNLSFGPKILSDVASYLVQKEVAVDCHLMVALTKKTTVKEFLQPFIIEGVRSITLHYEALSKKQLKEFLNWKDAGFERGLAISPDTNVSKILPYLTNLDLILVMSVQPGFGNQKFIAASYDKIKAIHDYLKNNHLEQKPIIAVDGGVNDETAPECISAGANYLVSGSYLLNSENSIKKQVEKLVS